MNSEPSLESDLKARKLYGRLAVISLFSLATLHGIHSFFFTFFFWLSAGFLGITLYYHILIKRQQSPSSRFTGEPPHRESSQSSTSPQQSKRFVIFGALAVFGIFFLTILFSIVFSSNGDDATTEITTSDLVDGELYQQAVGAYNEKNYRGTIELLRPELLKGVSDSQSMLLLGDGYYSSQDLDSAYIWYSKAYDLGQRSAILSHLIAYILDTKGSTIQSIDFYKEALSQDSSIVEIYTRLAELEPNKAQWYSQKAVQFKAN
jgi:tetratricopeptide (TPR) repeat protein